MRLAGIALTLSILALAAQSQAADMQLPELKTQPSPQAVLDEHLDALNKCDWNRSLAQYPDDAQIHVLNGTVITGRKAIGDLFAGFCKDSKDGGLNGINFKVVQSTLIGNTFATHWVATAPFLAEPYNGSDAFITKDGFFQSMGTTFDGGALKVKKKTPADKTPPDPCIHGRRAERPPGLCATRVMRPRDRRRQDGGPEHGRDWKTSEAYRIT